MILNHCPRKVHKNTMSIESLTPSSLLNNYQYKGTSVKSRLHFNVCYLDHAGATLYAESQIEAVSQDLCNNVYGNPHSLSLSSRFATDVIDQIRYRNFTAHIEEVTGRAQRVLNKIVSIGQRRFHLPMRVIKSYHQVILLSIVGYAACVWAHRLNNAVPARAVRSIQRNVLLRLSGAYRTVATDALCVTLGIWPLDLLVRKRAVGYWMRKNKLDRVRILTSPEVETSIDADISMWREWQSRWEASETGRRTYQLFPNVVERVDNEHLEPSPGLVQFITGKGPYPESLWRMGLVESELCECGEVGTPEHVVLECARTLEIRRPNQQEVQGCLVGGIIRDPTKWRFLDKLAAEATERAKTDYIRALRERRGLRQRDNRRRDREGGGGRLMTVMRRWNEDRTGERDWDGRWCDLSERCLKLTGDAEGYSRDWRSILLVTRGVGPGLEGVLCIGMEIGGYHVAPLYHRGGCILHHFKTNPEEYSLIFTSSATAALKVVAETFDWAGQDEIEKTKDNYEQSKGITHNADIDEKNECVEIPENESLNVGKPVYDGSPGVFVYLQDNHTSVLGMRELAANKCKQTHCISHNDIFQELNTEPEQENSIDIDTYSGNSLFVYPAQCNFSGVKYPLEWISQTQNGALNKYINKNASVLSSKRTKWFCMLDAASFVSTNRLDLSSIKPDFVSLSFYKIFGYPTGLGALLVKNSSSDVLKKSYFGGGTVLIALSSERYHVPRPTLSDRFEDGTLPFLSILALRHGFDTLKQLCGSIEDIAMHTFSLAQSLFLNLISLHHSNGAPAVVLYTDTDYQNIDTQGGIVNFNLLRANGEYVGFVEVLNMANLYDIQLRTGCFCNTGACQRHLRLSSQDLKHQFQAGHVCGDERDLIDGKPTGSVRVSFGYMSTKEDVDRVLRMITTCFLEEPVIHKLPDWWPLHVETYRKKFHNSLKPPAKMSCGALSVSSWSIGPRGLLYDREWMIITPAGVSLTQKQDTKLCLIKPNIQLDKDQLCLDFPGKLMDELKNNSLSILQAAADVNTLIVNRVITSATQRKTSRLRYSSNKLQARHQDVKKNLLFAHTVCVSLSTPSASKGRSEVSLCQSKVCGDRVQGYDCGDEVAQWLSDALCRDGLRLIRQQDSDTRAVKAHKKTNLASGTGKKSALSLSNQAQFLLVNDCSIDWLKEQLEDSAEYSQRSRSLSLKQSQSETVPSFQSNLLARFRCNLAVQGKKPFEENEWTNIQIGEVRFQSEGMCTRCQMVCIDQSTGEKTREPLHTIAASFQGKMRFGMYFSHRNETHIFNISVGEKVLVLQ
uniref:Molybdenum cofactor sulfurase n=1 Tax=Timema tahoe TaxID=61484 RepID=A0A7R9FMP8_9NEOP|nr:unnamed protein product [Timema tahoe]